MMKIFAKIYNWPWHHVCAFILTYFSYAFFRASREAFDDTKNTLNKSVIFKNSIKSYGTNEDPIMFFVNLDIVFAYAYAIGLYISGSVGDRLNLRYMLTFGMCSSAVTTLIIGYLPNIIKSSTPSKYYYYALTFVNGLFQSTGWPITVAIMGNWFNKGDILHGLWGGNSPVGNIIGSSIINYSLIYDSKTGVLLNCCLLFFGGLIVFFCLITHPNQVGLEESNLSNIHKKHVSVNIKKAVGFMQAFSMPGVSSYALSYSFVKIVTTIFTFSLSTYLTQDPQWGDQQFMFYYDLGSLFGGITAGILSKLIGMRSPVISLMLLFSIVTICLNYKTEGGHTNSAIIFFNGFLIEGPDNIISTAIPVDLSKNDQIKNNTQALATVTGIIDGTGHFAAAVSQCLILVIKKKFSWNGVFYSLIFISGCSFFWSLLILYKDISIFIKNYVKL